MANRYDTGQTFTAICIQLCQNVLVKSKFTVFNASNDSNNHLNLYLSLIPTKSKGTLFFNFCIIGIVHRLLKENKNNGILYLIMTRMEQLGSPQITEIDYPVIFEMKTK